MTFARSWTARAGETTTWRSEWAGLWKWNPLSAWWLDSYSLAYTVASLLNQLFGKGKEPFWQQAYTNLVRWIIELHRVLPEQWVTLQQVYQCAIDPDLFAAKIKQAEAVERGAKQRGGFHSAQRMVQDHGRGWRVAMASNRGRNRKRNVGQMEPGVGAETKEIGGPTPDGLGA